MKRILIVFLFTGMGLNVLLLGISCSNQTPNTAFIAPAQTVAANNPAWTPTPTFTFTPTFTITPTPIPYPISGFNAPYALAIDSKNNIYVGDTNNSLIKQYVNGFLNTAWPSGKAKSSNGLSYTSPKAIAVDYAGYLYVVGSGNNVVSKFDPNGNFLVQYTTTLLAMNGPLGVAVNSTATTLYVSDSGNNRIMAFSLPGGASSVFESLSYVPEGLAVGSNGDLYVAGSGSISSNVYIYTLSSPATVPTIIPGFNSPYAVALDSHNDLFVSDKDNKQIEEFTVGNYFNVPASIIGLGMLVSPEGIALDSSANVYVVDSGNSELFQFP